MRPVWETCCGDTWRAGEDRGALGSQATAPFRPLRSSHRREALGQGRTKASSSNGAVQSEVRPQVKQVPHGCSKRRAREEMRMRRVTSRDPQVGWVVRTKSTCLRVPVGHRRCHWRRTLAVASLRASVPSTHRASVPLTPWVTLPCLLTRCWRLWPR